MSTAIAKRESASKFELIVNASAERLATALPEHFTPAKLVQVLSIIAYKTPDLAKCVPESIITSIITAGSLGFDLTPLLGECYLLPIWNKDLVVNGEKGAYECQCRPGYKGLAKLALQTGEIKYIDPRIVRDGEEFRVWYDPEVNLFHEPKFDDEARITHIYCMTKLTNDERKIEVMTTAQIEKIRARSKCGNSGPWVTDWAQMGKKTVFKRQSNYLPRSVKLATAIALDNLDYERDEDETPAHHAISFASNNTGHGSERYASPETINAFSKWLVPFVAEKNRVWHEAMKKKGERVYAEVLKWNNGNLLRTAQVSGHILKWAKAEGLINSPETPKNGQYDKLSAIAWEREPERTQDEATAYARRKWGETQAECVRRATGDHVERPTPLEPEDESQEGPDDDLIDAAAGFSDDTFEEGRE